MIFCIDPGHGGSDPGAVAEDNKGKIAKEKYINLAIAEKLEKILAKKGHKIIMTRKSDEFVALARRAEIANNAYANIFISLHCNASRSPAANGTETLYYPTSRNGKLIAEKIQEKLIKKLQRADRGIKPRDNLAVLKRTKMPAVLVEFAFLSNDTERKLLTDDGFRLLAAEGITEGLESYFGGDQA